MVRTTSLVATAVSLLSLSSARIIGFAVPSIVQPDSDIKIQIVTENYIQSMQDVAFSFGLAPANISVAGTGALYQYLSSRFLGPDESNLVGNITHYVHIPVTTSEGDYVVSGAHFLLEGAVFSPDILNYVANVTVGGEGSPEYVMSRLVPASQ